jgi:hypothetical protein
MPIPVEVPMLCPTPRAEADLVVTEHGIAECAAARWPSEPVRLSQSPTRPSAPNWNCGGDHNVDQRVGRDRTEQHPQARHVLEGGDHREEVLKRDQHQTKPDSHPAEIARAG